MDLAYNAYNPLQAVDARTQLAGANKMEILLFSLGSSETFGMNVFKIREVTKTPKITLTPNMHPAVEGIISLRGNIIPVLNLKTFFNLTDTGIGETMIVTEFSGQTQGFLVHSVDRIMHLDWDRIKSPEGMIANEELVTAITELEDGRLVSIPDVEQILVSAFGMPNIPALDPADAPAESEIFFADDSLVARKEIVQVLERLGVKYLQAVNGKEAWEKLQAIATQGAAEGSALHKKLKLILTDAEMPEMDGYVLTRNIKSDARFSGIPVIMHSSLSSEANKTMGKAVGVDNYVSKFDPQVLADTLRPYLER